VSFSVEQVGFLRNEKRSEVGISTNHLTSTKKPD